MGKLLKIGGHFIKKKKKYQPHKNILFMNTKTMIDKFLLYHLHLFKETD